MNWTDDAVGRALALLPNAGLTFAEAQEAWPRTVVAVMDLATELLAGRGGTMTAEEIASMRNDNEQVPLPWSRGTIRRLLESHTAQGARVAALEQHIAELEKSLENARKERDDWQRRWQQEDDAARHAREALQVEREEWRTKLDASERSLENARCSEEAWRKRMNKAADALSDVLPGEVGRLDLLARISELKRQRDVAYQKGRDDERSFSTNSGQVAEDVKTIRSFLSSCESDCPGRVALDDSLCPKESALSRLVAKAQGYEAFAAACREAIGPHRSTGTPADVALLHKDLEAARAFSVQFGKERAAAVADNAELVALFNEVANAPRPRSGPTCAWCGTRDHHPLCPVGRALANPHPGTALLERMKALEEGERKASLEAADLGLALSGLFEFPDSRQVREQAREVCESQEAGKDLMERMKRLEAVLDLVRSEAKMLADNGRIQIQAIGHGLLAMMKPLDGH